MALSYTDSKRNDKFGNEFRYRAVVNPDGDGKSKDGHWAYDVFFMSLGRQNSKRNVVGGRSVASGCSQTHTLLDDRLDMGDWGSGQVRQPQRNNVGGGQ